MFSPNFGGANLYARVGVETGVLSASPHRLISLLFQGAREAIGHARLYLGQGEVASRGQALSKAIRIIDQGLRAALNKDAGGELAVRLDTLYAYMSRRLFEGNLRQEEAVLIEVDGLLATLEEAWNAVDPSLAQSDGRVSGAGPR